MKTIALFGTSANPPHNGHVKLIKNILDSELADEVWVIPVGSHAFSKELASAKDRWRMAKMIETKKIKVKDFEIKSRKTSYTIDTVSKIIKKYPNTKFLWVTGSDIIKNKDYKKWKDWDGLIKMVDLLVFPRKGYLLSKTDRTRFRVINSVTPDISSTQIRARIKTSKSISRLVPYEIEVHIKKKKLYEQRDHQPK